MTDIDKELAAYEKMRAELEAEHMAKWVLIQGGTLVGVFDSMEAAAQDAVPRFGRGPYLIRQVGAPPVTLPASVMWNVSYGSGKVRVR